MWRNQTVKILNWFFQISDSESARSTARERMQKMLVYDRLELPAGRLEVLEEELLAVVSRYFELDAETTHFDLQQTERKAALIADFRLLRAKC